MSFAITLIVGLLTNHLVSCAITDPKSHCAHKNYNDNTSDPIVLDENKKLCAEREMYTPPELACAFPQVSMRAFHTGQINAINNTPKIRIAGRDDIPGSAKGVFYKKNTKVIKRDILQCLLYSYQPHQPNNQHKIRYISFTNATDCQRWFDFPETAACNTFRRFRDEMNGIGFRFAVPTDCRLISRTTFRANNRGDDGSRHYLHGTFAFFRGATLYLSESDRDTMMHVSGRQDEEIRDETIGHYEQGYAISHKFIYVFQPFKFQDLCPYNAYKTVDLKIIRHVEENNKIAVYHFSPKTPLTDGKFEFNISESDFQALKKVKKNVLKSFTPCHDTDIGYRIVNLEDGNMVTVSTSKLPTSKKKEEIACVVRPDNWHSRELMMSAEPHTTKVIDVPDKVEEHYWNHRRHKNQFASKNVYCISYPETVVMWVRLDMTLTKIEYVTDNGVVFSNTYNHKDVRTQVPNRNHCLLSGSADKCSWLEKCGANKYCEHHECKCKKKFTTLNSECVTKKVCANGFRYVKTTNECEDIDECNTSPCKDHKNGQNICANTAGGFSCVAHTDCPRGTILNVAHQKCADINECEHPILNSCDPKRTTCRNRNPGYECVKKKQLRKKKKKNASSRIQLLTTIPLLLQLISTCVLTQFFLS
ncbi:latent-transforming growth factor beta-binding protein 1 [Elysia marginata]|uniref:Latent-transforming growth factor beta-binding protein 1 n=1 Tax=Elysia marginata TaxID=1093978 RepID=A0AAV4GY91_9GAST|nr:latent-transforming growth factor beta-binding protein 1 [Elysia marginata]